MTLLSLLACGARTDGPDAARVERLAAPVEAVVRSVGPAGTTGPEERAARGGRDLGEIEDDDDDDDDDHEDDEDDEGHEDHHGPTRAAPVRSASLPGVPPVTDPTWQSECGSCHLAYSPGLLPARSWDHLLANLGDHFGDDASVDDATRETLRTYALGHAADVVPYRLSRSIAAASAGRTPDRILDVGFLRHEHDEVPRSIVAHPEVRSLSNCAACHPAAEEGRFSEDTVSIPGIGRWDD